MCNLEKVVNVFPSKTQLLQHMIIATKKSTNLWHPFLKRGLELVVILIIPQSNFNHRFSSQFDQSLFDVDSSLVEVTVGGIPETKGEDVHAGQGLLG